jgi:hypothetical protein
MSDLLEKRMSAQAKIQKTILGAVVQHHSEMAECHKVAMDNCEKDSLEADFHKAACESHLACGETVARAAMDQKSMTEEMDKSQLDEMVPSNISRVAPAPPGIRMVPRAGAPAQSDRVEVPKQFEKMVSVEDE